MKTFILILSVLVITFGAIPSAQADHGDRFCRVERRCDRTGLPLYRGYGYSPQSAHHGYHYHTVSSYRPRYDEGHQHRHHHHSRTGGFRFFSR